MTDKERESLNNEELNNTETTGESSERTSKPAAPSESGAPVLSEMKRDGETPAKPNKEKTPAPKASAAASGPAPKAWSGGTGKIWMAVSLVLAVILVIVLIKPPFNSGSNPTVATVNGTDIKKDKLYDALVDAGGKQTLDSLITEELVNQEASKKGIKVTDADVTKEMDDIKKGFSSDEEFQMALQQSGMSVEDLKKQMNMQVQIRKLLEPEVKVTDDDIKKYFDENKASFNTPEEVKASHILVKTKDEAEGILKQLKGGADFATLAKEKSIDPGSKDNGGDLGFFAKGVMEAPFEEAAFKLQKGEMSGIVQSSNGYHIIKVTDRKAAHTATLDEKKADIKETLITQGISSKASTWIADLKSKAKITNSLDDSANAATDTAAGAGAADTAANTTK